MTVNNVSMSFMRNCCLEMGDMDSIYSHLYSFIFGKCTESDMGIRLWLMLRGIFIRFIHRRCLVYSFTFIWWNMDMLSGELDNVHHLIHLDASRCNLRSETAYRSAALTSVSWKWLIPNFSISHLLFSYHSLSVVIPKTFTKCDGQWKIRRMKSCSPWDENGSK